MTAAELRTDALTGRVRRRDVRRFYRPFAAKHPSVRSLLTPARRVVVGIGAVAVAIGLLAMATGISEEVAQARHDMVGELIAMSAIVALMVIAGGVLVWWYVRTTLRRGTPKRHYRLAHFAADNGMAYHPGPYPGKHLTPWADRGHLVLTRVIRPATRRGIEFANYELSHGATSSRNTQFGGYCAVRLRTRLPHILLQAANTGPRLLSAAGVPAGAQHLSLEGDFDRSFRLFCPAQYERDALYLFTPDVMARLVDRVSGFDVELIDDWLFLSRSKDVVTLDPATWRGLMDAVNALGDKIGQWERWRDDRVVPAAATDPARGTQVPHGQVAEGGRRLRMRLGRGTWIWLGVAAAVVAAIVIANMLS